jgi:hypothetical protein
VTDARVPDQWLGHPTYSDLSDQAWRFFIHGLQWSNRYGTDGVIATRHFHTLGVFAKLDAVLLELQDAGLIALTQDGIALDWTGQSLASEVANRKELNRLRASKQRDKARTVDSSPKASKEIASEIVSDVARDVTRDVTREVGQDRTRTGQDTTGQVIERVDPNDEIF